jgi:hypothetical protein
MFVLPKQPVSITYKITTKTPSGKLTPQNRQGPNNIQALALTVDYRCLKEVVLSSAEQIFTTAIEESSLHRLGRLLVPLLLDRLEHRILPSQFEKITLLEKANIGSFDDMGWYDCIESLPQLIRDDTRRWLKKWHEVIFGQAPYRYILILAEQFIHPHNPYEPRQRGYNSHLSTHSHHRRYTSNPNCPYRFS